MSIETIAAIKQGMLHDNNRIAIINENIVHQNDYAYKAKFIDSLTSSSTAYEQRQVIKTLISFKQGPLNQTKKKLDVAIIGQGFFSFKTSHGIVLSRDGRLHLNPHGQLCNQHQDLLISDGQIISLSPESFEIKTNGEIWQRGALVGKINLIHVNKLSELKYVGKAYFSADNIYYGQDKKSHIVQYHLESSNVDFVQNSAQLMKSTRHYALLSRLMKVDDSLENDVISQVIE